MRTRLLGGVLASLLAIAGQARAEPTPLRIGYSFISEFIPAFVARDHGIFARHGIDAEMVPIANSSTVPAAVTSNSVEIGGMNVAIFLQGLDGGLDMVSLAGSSMIPNHDAPIGLVTSPGWNYAGPQSLEGKAVAMPGIGSSVDVLFRRWAQDAGADPQRIRIVEIPLPQIPDSLRTNSVESAVLVEPFMTRALKSGQARMAVHFADTLPHPVIAILYASNRAWADAHKDVVAEFRAAIAEAVTDAKADPAAARASLANYIKLPPDALAALPQPTMTPVVTTEQMGWWIDQMHGQGFLQKQLDPAKTIFP